MNKIIPKDPVLKVIFFISLAAIIIPNLFIGISFSKLPARVPLFYSHPWGEAQLSSVVFLFVPIALAVSFLVLNIVLNLFVFKTSFLRRALSLGTAASIILAGITVIRIVFLVM